MNEDDVCRSGRSLKRLPPGVLELKQSWSLGCEYPDLLHDV